MTHRESALELHAGRLVVHHDDATCGPVPEKVTHTEHALAYVVRGAVSIEYAATVEAEAGALVVVPAGVPHRHIRSRDAERWVVGFCATCVELDEEQRLMAPFARVRRGALPVVQVPRGRRARVVRLFRDLAAENERDAPEATELARCTLLLLLGELVRAMPRAPAEAPSGSFVADALEYIQKNALEPISLRDVAAAVQRTPSHVAATMKAETGFSVGDWITSARLSEATAWLLHTDSSIDEITERVGWRDKTHFIRQFKKTHGETPAAWRRARRR